MSERSEYRSSRILVLTLSIVLGRVTGSRAADEIVVTKFNGHVDHSSTLAIYRRDPVRGYVPDRSRYAGVDRPIVDCPSTMRAFSPLVPKTVYQSEQLKALDRYVETGYMTREEAAGYLERSVEFSHRPVAFFHSVSDDVSVSKMVGIAPDHYMAIGLDGSAPRGIVASLYLLPGQYLKLDSEGIKAVEAALPWTLDPAFEAFVKSRFGREKHALTWEVGRAAGGGGREFIDLLSFAGREILIQMMHLGFPQPSAVEHATVTFHALNAENKEKFAKLFPRAEIIESATNPDNCVFLVPLSHYLGRFPPYRAAFEYRAFQKVAPGFDPAKAAAILAFTHFSKTRLLDFRYGGKFVPQPLVVSTVHSDRLYLHELGGWSEIFGLSDGNWSAVRNGLGTDMVVEGEKPWRDVIVDPSSPQLLARQPRSRMAIQISNLDPARVEKDPLYVIGALGAAYVDFIRVQLSGEPDTEANVRNILLRMHDLGIEFVVTTNHLSTARALKSYNPVGSFEMDIASDFSSGIFWEELRRHGHSGRFPEDGKFRGFYFKPLQIHMIRAQGEAIFRQIGSEIPDTNPMGFFWSLLGSSSP